MGGCSRNFDAMTGGRPVEPLPGSLLSEAAANARAAANAGGGAAEQRFRSLLSGTTADARAAPAPQPAAQPQAPAVRQRAPAHQWDMGASIAHLQRNSPENRKSQGECAKYVGDAIEAGGARINRALNNSAEGDSAYGYGPVVESGGYRAMPEGTKEQAGDVVVIQPTPKHKRGHVAMYDGKVWRSDFIQDHMYPSMDYLTVKPPFTLYRRP